MKKIFILVMLITTLTFSQYIYEVTPGTKGNEIKLTVANISETNAASNIVVKLTKKSSSLNFSKEEVTLELLEAKTEAEALFRFDVERNASINKKDTIEFMITSSDGIMMMKQFIFSYTVPKEFKLEQNYPNPFNPSTSIQYQVSSISSVSLKVYDILGSEVATLVNEEQQPGYYEVQFNGNSLASGLYIYRLSANSGAGNYISTKKMMLIK